MPDMSEILLAIKDPVRRRQIAEQLGSKMGAPPPIDPMQLQGVIGGMPPGQGMGQGLGQAMAPQQPMPIQGPVPMQQPQAPAPVQQPAAPMQSLGQIMGGLPNG